MNQGPPKLRPSISIATTFSRGVHWGHFRTIGFETIRPSCYPILINTDTDHFDADCPDKEAPTHK